MRYVSVMSVCSLLSLAGCRHVPSARANSVMPPKGSVKVIPKKVTEGPKKVQWVWTILGDRNWSNTSISNNVVTISGSFPLNSLTRTGGTHVWELWITAAAAESNVASAVNVEIKLRGSNGAGVTTQMSMDRIRLKDALLPLMKQTDTARLPAEFDIAEIGGRTIKLAIRD